MKKIITLIFLAIIYVISSSQNPVITVFSEEGKKFWLIVDGEKKNQDPQYRVANIKLDKDWARVKIIFEDPSLPAIDKTIPGVDADGKAIDATWKIKCKKSGKYTLQMSSFKSITASSTGTIKSTTTTDKTPQTTTQQTQTTQQTEGTQTPSSQTEKISIDMKIDETKTNYGINISVTAPEQAPATSITTTTIQEAITTQASVPQTQAPDPLPGYTGPTACPYPISPTDFNNAKNSIASKSFEDSKLTIAKQIISSNCLLASQVKEIMMLFDFEDSKLEIAKFAYKYTYDIGNYYKVNDAFEFESSIDELNQYIQSLKN